ncbi:hypothetical protein FJ251_07115 [bacterium]|nr:hypothetical protein [bacterium]
MTAQTLCCPSCGATYAVPPSLMEKGELRVRCPQCQQGFRLRWVPPAAPPATAIAAESSLPAGPAAAPGPAAPAPAGLNAQQEARRARRFARALAESILQGPGRRERRDRALAEGRLIPEFSRELREAWRLYVDKVGEDYAHSSPAFRDAFNEILADGQPLF